MTTAAATKAPPHADQRRTLQKRRTTIAKRIEERRVARKTAEQACATEREQHGAASPAARRAFEDAKATLAELEASLKRVDKGIVELDELEQHTDRVAKLTAFGKELLEPTSRAREAADSLADALVELRPLLRQFHMDAHALGVTLPPTFVTGQSLE